MDADAFRYNSSRLEGEAEGDEPSFFIYSASNAVQDKLAGPGLSA